MKVDYFIVVFFLLLMCIPLAVSISDARDAAKREAVQKDAESRAYMAEGRVARFGAGSEYDGDVIYTFQLQGAPAVYRVGAEGLSAASHGELTKEGDFVTFQVLPGLPRVRNFYNAATAKA